MTPETLREAARRLWHLADRVPAPIEHVRARSGADTWIGPAAARFASELETQRRLCLTAADELRATARRLFSRADILEQELAAQARRPDSGR